MEVLQCRIIVNCLSISNIPMDVHYISTLMVVKEDTILRKEGRCLGFIDRHFSARLRYQRGAASGHSSFMVKGIFLSRGGKAAEDFTRRPARFRR